MIPSWLPKRKMHERIVDNEGFYNSSKWRKFSRFYKDNHPLCIECEREGLVGPADVTDHIIRIEAGGDKWSEDNMQSLCNQHHNSKSGRESGANYKGDTPQNV
jgi:5-methylcytosine-specific restriction endonuclease McrA